VSNYSASTVTVIDAATRTVVKTIATTAQPRGVAVTPDGRFLYVAVGTYYTGYSMSVFDTASATLVASIPDSQAGDQAQLSMSPDGQPFFPHPLWCQRAVRPLIFP
jgi:YVTN family beta-propeller protein